MRPYFYPLITTLAVVLTERTLDYESMLAKFLGLDSIYAGRLLMSVAIYQITTQKEISRLWKVVFNHLNYSKFSRLYNDGSESFLSENTWNFIRENVTSIFWPSVFYNIIHGNFDLGLWRSAALRYVAIRAAIGTVWSLSLSLIFLLCLG